MTRSSRPPSLVAIDVNTSTPEADRTRRWAYDRLCDHSSFYPEIDCVGGASDASVCHLLKCEQFAAELQVMQMSYMYSIWDLWDVESIEPVADEPGNFTVSHHGRIASVVLFSFSFVWPHLKLMLMHIFFYIPLTSRRRRNGNYWLGVFGKWSFTDVLVMAALVGVFHLVIDTSVRDLWSRGAAEATHSCELACQSRLGVHTEGAGGAKPLSERMPWMARGGRRSEALRGFAPPPPRPRRGGQGVGRRDGSHRREPARELTPDLCQD